MLWSEHHDSAIIRTTRRRSPTRNTALRQRHKAIEESFPEFVTTEIAVAKIGAAPSGRFRKVRHAVPMLSLDNAFAEEDVRRFRRAHRRFLKLTRTQDRFQRRAEDRRAVDVAALRGRRTRHRGHPRRRRGGRGRHRQYPHARGRSAEAQRPRNVPDICEVRGEVYMTKQAFLALNERQGRRRNHVRQSAQFGGGLAAPEGSLPSPPRGRSAFSPTPGARWPQCRRKPSPA